MRRLTLTRETLTELTADDLVRVNAASADCTTPVYRTLKWRECLDTFLCVSEPTER